MSTKWANEGDASAATSKRAAAVAIERLFIGQPPLPDVTPAATGRPILAVLPQPRPRSAPLPNACSGSFTTDRSRPTLILEFYRGADRVRYSPVLDKRRRARRRWLAAPA